MPKDSNWLSAAEATRRLGIKRATLYAYVSRGLIRSAPRQGRTRERLYAREDIERARRRAEDHRDATASAAHALDLGSPVLESAITLIAGGRLFYRGFDAVMLSRARSVGEVASLIWSGRFDDASNALPASSRPRAIASDVPPLARAQMLLAQAAVRDPLAFDLRRHPVTATAARILDLMTYAVTGIRERGASVEDELTTAWKLRRGGLELIRAAIILCADHELNVSAFTARCVASAGGSPYGVVIAALSALEGVRHGGITARVESMLESMRRERSAAAALGARIREGGAIDGFGHPLYPNGDPRAAELLAQLEVRFPRSAELAFAREVSETAWEMLELHPSVDFALATLSRVLRLPPRSGLALFAIGRTIGWLGQGIEQYDTGQLIRPRAKYVGPFPSA
jgi:citrate synthase